MNRLYISKTFWANYNSFILILKYPIIFMRFSVLANFSIFLASSSFTSSLNYICNMIYISKDMNLNNTGNDSLYNGLIWNLRIFMSYLSHVACLSHKIRSRFGMYLCISLRICIVFYQKQPYKGWHKQRGQQFRGSRLKKRSYNIRKNH